MNPDKELEFTKRLVEALETGARASEQMANAMSQMAVSLQKLERLTHAITDVYDVGTVIYTRETNR